tara:strand:+ start:5954 stop:6805 length:852 start_codon:yes stop_codon:yes gene_type:complete
MPNLKEIRSRIVSVSSTMKITSAMKMVSAAKLKKAQDRMQNIKPYSTALNDTIQNLIPSVSSSDIDLTKNFSEDEARLIVPISSNRGLCGAFNANVFKEVQSSKNQDKIEVYAIGKKSIELFKRAGYKIIGQNSDIIDSPNYNQSKKISNYIIEGFKLGKWSSVSIVCNLFKNAATQSVINNQILPIYFEPNNIRAKDYIFEPDKKIIINKLVPDQIHTKLFESILNSVAAEHGARMTAMHKATDNANELKQNLTLSYNRQRQAAITNEILEIVAGAEALKGS